MYRALLYTLCILCESSVLSLCWNYRNSQADAELGAFGAGSARVGAEGSSVSSQNGSSTLTASTAISTVSLTGLLNHYYKILILFAIWKYLSDAVYTTSAGIKHDEGNFCLFSPLVGPSQAYSLLLMICSFICSCQMTNPSVGMAWRAANTDVLIPTQIVAIVVNVVLLYVFHLVCPFVLLFVYGFVTKYHSVHPVRHVPRVPVVVLRKLALDPPAIRPAWVYLKYSHSGGRCH